MEVSSGRYPLKWLKAGILGLILVTIAFRFLHLEADFPSGIDWSTDLYTDEGWYSGNATAWALTGNWYVEGDFNSIITLPVFQLIQMASFRLLGVSLFSARVSVALLSVIMLVLVFLLTQRLADGLTAWIATTVLAVNFFVFAFSRLALLEIPITVFVLCSLLLVISWHHTPYPAAVLAGLVFALAVLTKTPAVLFFPALLYATWTRPFDLQVHSQRRRIVTIGLLLTSVITFLLIPTAYALWRFNTDYQYLTTANVELRFNGSLIFLLSTLTRTLYNGILIDKWIYPFTLLATPILLVISRRFRHSRLVILCLLLISPYFVYLASRGYLPPRYYVPMSIPVILLFSQMMVLAYRKLLPSRWAWVPMGVIAVIVVINLGLIINYLRSPQYSFRDMGRDINSRINSQPNQGIYLIGNLANSISLVTGIPSINTELGTQDLKWKLQWYQPEYYISLGKEKDIQKKLLKNYDIQEVASYDVFGNYQRGKQVIFYRLVARPVP